MSRGSTNSGPVLAGASPLIALALLISFVTSGGPTTTLSARRQPELGQTEAENRVVVPKRGGLGINHTGKG